jgi:UDP-N-acetylmuramyl tripeptide synthase
LVKAIVLQKITTTLLDAGAEANCMSQAYFSENQGRLDKFVIEAHKKYS